MKKGIFLWQVHRVEGGEPSRIAPILKEASISRIDVKVAQEDRVYHVFNGLKWVPNVKRDWVRAMQGLGFKIWGWGFIHGDKPEGEGMIGASQVAELGLDGYIFDAEGKFEKHTDCSNRAYRTAKAFTDNAPGVPSGLTSWPLWRNPWDGRHWHNENMAIPFMDALDYAVPMTYWWNGHAILWLEKSIEQWHNLVTDKPIVPAGRAYSGEGLGTISPAEMKAWGLRVRELGLLGESWWELRIALKKTEVWEVIKNLPAFDSDPLPVTHSIELTQFEMDALKSIVIKLP